MFRNLLVIFILAGCLAIMLIVKPWQSEPVLPARIYDRLPEADLIGQTDFLAISGSLSETMFYFRLPFRDFLSPGFMLSQGKNYGLDFQSPVFFFANEENNEMEDCGAIISIKDSSKVKDGINRVIQFTDITDTIIYKTKVYMSKSNNVYMTYGDDWLFVYYGNHLKKRLRSVLFAKRNEINPKWRSFLNDHKLDKQKIIAQLFSNKLDRRGIESVVMSMSNDSSSVTINAEIKQFDSLSFQLKAVGPSFDQQAYSKNIVNLHFNMHELRTRPNDPVYMALAEIGKKVSFPTRKFLNAWEGDLAFRQGGFQVIKEKYVESELDENFNVTETIKYKDVKILGFALYLSINEEGKSFLSQLFTKGILTKNDNTYRALYSPPFKMKVSDTSIMIHSGNYSPKLQSDSINSILWTMKYTPYEFYIDSTSVRTVYGRLKIPLEKVISQHLPEL